MIRRRQRRQLVAQDHEHRDRLEVEDVETETAQDRDRQLAEFHSKHRIRRPPALDIRARKRLEAFDGVLA
jgi:hypothetical protein